MNKQLAHFFAVAQKPERLIIGLMSGTSVDGLDVALCRFRGNGMDARPELLAFCTVPYDPDFKAEIKSVFAKREADLEKVTLLHPWIALKHAEIVLDCLQKWQYSPSDIDLIASHGQTIYHAPERLHHQAKFGNATLQIGDGDHLAVATGIITLSDFRQKHIAAGGEGAPLAAYGDFLIFSQTGENRIMLNMGGIANFTHLPGSLNADEVFSTDVGPGNTLMDAYIQTHFPGRFFDENAQVAASGQVVEPLLHALKDDPFFAADFPKTTGPELFSLRYLHAAQTKSNTLTLPVADVMATLNRFSADTIAEAVQRAFQDRHDFVIYMSGGGMHNPLLVNHLKAQLPSCQFRDTSALTIHPDAKEAVLFAVLANECVSGGSVNYGTGRNGIPNVSMGKVSFPG